MNGYSISENALIILFRKRNNIVKLNNKIINSCSILIYKTKDSSNCYMVSVKTISKVIWGL